jgi:hypothetical protein
VENAEFFKHCPQKQLCQILGGAMGAFLCRKKVETEDAQDAGNECQDWMRLESALIKTCAAPPRAETVYAWPMEKFGIDAQGNHGALQIKCL